MKSFLRYSDTFRFGVEGFGPSQHRTNTCSKVEEVGKVPVSVAVRPGSSPVIDKTRRRYLRTKG